GYISSSTQYPEACYRWLSFIAKQPDLFEEMPAYYSVINNETFTNTHNPNITAFYSQIAQVLKDPNTVPLPDSFELDFYYSGEDVILHWLYAAFDSYIFNKADLESELKHAEFYTKEYLACMSSQAPLQFSNVESQKSYYSEIKNCAIKVDPSSSNF